MTYVTHAERPPLSPPFKRVLITELQRATREQDEEQAAQVMDILHDNHNLRPVLDIIRRDISHGNWLLAALGATYLA